MKVTVCAKRKMNILNIFYIAAKQKHQSELSFNVYFFN